MILNKGEFNGKRIVSEKYIEMATKKQIDIPDCDLEYGFHFWVNFDHKSCRADGKYGQFIFVIPDKDMVVAIQSLDSGDVLKNVWDNLIEKL